MGYKVVGLGGGMGSSTSTVIAGGRGVKTMAVPSSKHQQTGPTPPDQKHAHPVSTTTTRSVTTSVSSTHTVTKSSTPLTSTGAVRKLFTLTSQGVTQATVVVTATHTLSYPPKTISTSAHSSTNIKPIVSTASNTPTTKPPIPPVGIATAGSGGGGGGKQPVSTVNGPTPLSRGGEAAKSSVVKSVCPPGSGTTLRYSSVLGSQECQPSVIEQPLQQIMKTPTILQEPATQMTKPKKKSTCSDAVGKKLPSSEMGSHSAANKMGGVTSQHKLNLAPGTRPTMNDSGAMVKPAVYFTVGNAV